MSVVEQILPPSLEEAEARECVHSYCEEPAQNFVRFAAGARGSYCEEHTQLVRRAFEIRVWRPLTNAEKARPLRGEDE